MVRVVVGPKDLVIIRTDESFMTLKLLNGNLNFAVFPQRHGHPWRIPHHSLYPQQDLNSPAAADGTKSGKEDNGYEIIMRLFREKLIERVLPLFILRCGPLSVNDWKGYLGRSYGIESVLG